MASRYDLPRWSEHARPRARGTNWRWDVPGPAHLSVIRSDIRRRIAATSSLPGPTTEPSERLLLAFEELASNGLRHGGQPVQVDITVTDGCWLLVVSDSDGDRAPAVDVGRDPAQGGLGLQLTGALATAYGWVVTGSRKHVWACLPFVLPLGY